MQGGSAKNQLVKTSGPHREWSQPDSIEFANTDYLGRGL